MFQIVRQQSRQMTWMFSASGSFTMSKGADGVIVERIKRWSPFFNMKLEEGDRIYAINGVSDLCCAGHAGKLTREAGEVAFITDKEERIVGNQFGVT